VGGKMSFLLVACLLAISIMIGGCTRMPDKKITTTEKYPNRPITILVPWSPGSAGDLVARALEKRAKYNLGQPLIVVNKAGGTGTLCWNELAGATPDGYTIGISGSELLLNPLFLSTKYNYATALEPLTQITATPFLILVQANQPWQSIDELISYAKQHPEQLKFGHGGIGSLSHIVGETFSKKAGITMNQVPFQGTPEIIAALLGGHIQVAIANPGAAKEYIKNGMIKILAVSSEQHLTDPVLPNAQTFKEQGWEIVYNSRIGIAVPKETPSNIKDKLVEGLKAAVTAPEFKRDIENTGLQYEYLGHKASEERWITDSQELTKDVQETEILDLIKAQKN
jgi:tripartite-type tricarboxylate transporter receptor subunit TctC